MSGPELPAVIAEAAAQLAGAWKLVSCDDREDESSPWLPYGSDPRGLIVYDPSGTLSAHLVAEGPSPSSAGYLGYWGTFRIVRAAVDGQAIVGTVEHHMVGGSTRDLFEEGPERAFRLEHDQLTIGDGRTSRRRLERIHGGPS
jgi:Lipocalin-like domain